MNSRVAATVLLIAIAGCGTNTDVDGASTSAESTIETAAAPAILAPFQGAWRLSLGKTLAGWRASGIPADEIAEAEKFAAIYPLHPDINVRGDTAVLAGLVEGEYQFIALHLHDPWVCGKAWRHEDRHDPGDMDKIFVRLEVRDADLYLSVRTNEDSIDLTDPDLLAMPQTAGSADSCEADALAAPPWSPWRTYVFERGDGDDR